MLKDESKTEESSFYKSYKSNLLVISFIISVILIGSLIVFTKISSLYSYLENEKNSRESESKRGIVCGNFRFGNRIKRYCKLFLWY